MSTNLTNFINTINYSSRPHVNSNYIFDWPGVFTAYSEEMTGRSRQLRYGTPIIQNVSLDSFINHTELTMNIDGYKVPVHGTPKLPTSFSLELILEENFIDGTLGRISELVYTKDNPDTGSSGGFDNYNFRAGKGANEAMGLLNYNYLARLYVISSTYDMRDIGDFTNHPKIEIHFPKIKSIDNLAFNSRNTSLTRIRLSMTCAFMIPVKGRVI